MGETGLIFLKFFRKMVNIARIMVSRSAHDGLEALLQRGKDLFYGLLGVLVGQGQSSARMLREKATDFLPSAMWWPV